MVDKTIAPELQKDIDKQRAWAAEFIEKQARFCEDVAGQENEPEDKKRDLESADEFAKLAKKLRGKKPLTETELYDVLWIIREAYEELERDLEAI